ncbi:putative clathrin assembly protein, partial [Mucuna pruriens]
MRVWTRASGAIKDKNSIWVAKLSRKSNFHNPDLETVIIKATSHDDHHIDMKNVQRVFQWLRTSPLYLKPLIWALSMRMHKTRSWVVALKGLMLIHGIYCCDIPAVQCLGRLPFDLSNFSEGHLNNSMAWDFNAFVRGYFAYLDQRSAFVASEVKFKNNDKEIEVEDTLMEELEKLQKLQGMIDMLIQIKPRNEEMNVSLILEAMDCVIVEVFGVYSKLCNRIAKVLLRIYEVGGRVEAVIGLKVLQKASIQGEELCLFFEFCKDIGVLNASQCPKIEKISEEDIQDLEEIISGASSKKGNINVVANDEDKAIVLRDCSLQKKEKENGLMTVITHQWELFDDDVLMVGAKGMFNVSNGAMAISATTNNPFVESYSLVSYVPAHNQIRTHNVFKVKTHERLSNQWIR